MSAPPALDDGASVAGRRSPRARWALVSWLGAGALTIAALSVFWAFDALPFQDLPAHAGLIAMRHRFGDSPYEQRFFVLAPHLGAYSLFRFLGELFVVPLGPVGAVRAIAAFPLVATPLALVWARRQLHGDRSPAAAYFGLALGFGFMTLLGLASYLMGVAALIVALAVWLELMVEADSPGPSASRWEIAAMVVAPVVLLTHGYAFIVFLGLAGVSAMATGERRRRLMRVRALAPAVAFAIWMAWRDRASALPAGSVAPQRAAFALHFQGVADKLSLALTPTLITRTGVDVVVGLSIWGVIAAAVVATARSLRSPSPAAACERGRAHAKALLACLAALMAAFLILPHAIGWFGFVDGRLVPLLLMIGLLAVRRPALGRALETALDACAPAAALAMVAIALVASQRFQAEAAGWRDVLGAVPPKTRLLNLPIDPNSEVFTAHPFVHYDKLVLADRPVVVSDVWLHQGSALYPTAENPALRLPDTYSESDLRVIDWPSYRLSDWDYVLIRTRPLAQAPAVPPALALAAHRGGWWLFRNTTSAPYEPRPRAGPLSIRQGEFTR
jgi:hypothetical protein